LQQEGGIVGNVLIRLAIAACTSVPFNTSVAVASGPGAHPAECRHV